MGFKTTTTTKNLQVAVFSVMQQYQWYKTFFIRVPPDVISLQLCSNRVVLVQLSYRQSIIYI
jgi:hypothetical protein